MSVAMTFNCLNSEEKRLLLDYLVAWDAWAKDRYAPAIAPMASRVVGLCLHCPVRLGPVFEEHGLDRHYPFSSGRAAWYNKLRDCRKSRSRRKWVRDAIAALREELA